MRASRLLHMLLLLQNRGRLSARQLAQELEVTRRTILRDVDALSEAGLPIIVMRGNQGGIELGFNYRTRLTGLAEDEAEALTILLSQPRQVLDVLGLRASGERAVAKLVESFPDRVRQTVEETRRRFHFSESALNDVDIRIAAMAQAVRACQVVFLQADSAERFCIHPSMLGMGTEGWYVRDVRRSNHSIPLTEWGDINISSRKFLA